jgi:two-component system sensor histidine kinase ChvG
MRRLRPFARISLRLLLFNVLLVFLPAAGFLYLHVYERQLLDSQERSMVQQGRLLAASLGSRSDFGREEAERLLVALEQQTEARLRVYDAQGALLADSARFGPREEPAAKLTRYGDLSLDRSASAPDTPTTRESFLYRVGAGIYRAYRNVRSIHFFGRRYSADLSPQPAVRKALTGGYGALIRENPESLRPSLMLHSAIPIRTGDKVVGAVLVSQSTSRLLRSLDQVRLDIFKVILLSLGAALLVSLVLAGTIARPLLRLAGEARALLDRRGRLRATFRGSGRADEIGDLARALEELTRRIESHQRTLEGFAADISHELKNPLASIRAANEVLADVDDPAERQRFAGLVEREVARMERLLSAVREMGEVDARLEIEPTVPLDLRDALTEAVALARLKAERGVNFQLHLPADPEIARASPTRLAQALGNLLDNAQSFSPDGGTVEISLAAKTIEPGGMGDSTEQAMIRIEDRGPGIPEGNLDRLFDRFFTYRPNEPRARESHTGLGLAIVKSIVESYGGMVAARNRDGGGACFEVRLGVG